MQPEHFQSTFVVAQPVPLENSKIGKRWGHLGGEQGTGTSNTRVAEGTAKKGSQEIVPVPITFLPLRGGSTPRQAPPHSDITFACM